MYDGVYRKKFSFLKEAQSCFIYGFSLWLCCDSWTCFKRHSIPWCHIMVTIPRHAATAQRPHHDGMARQEYCALLNANLDSSITAMLNLWMKIMPSCNRGWCHDITVFRMQVNGGSFCICNLYQLSWQTG